MCLIRFYAPNPYALPYFPLHSLTPPLLPPSCSSPTNLHASTSTSHHITTLYKNQTRVSLFSVPYIFLSRPLPLPKQFTLSRPFETKTYSLPKSISSHSNTSLIPHHLHSASSSTLTTIFPLRTLMDTPSKPNNTLIIPHSPALAEQPQHDLTD